MITLNEIFISNETTEECQKALAMLLKTDDIKVYFDDEGFVVCIDYSIKIKQVSSGIIVSYRQEFGVGDPYMLFDIERQMMVVYLAFIDIFSIIPRIEDAGQEPMNEVSICCDFDSLSLERLQAFIDVALTVDSIFLSKYTKNVVPAENNRYFPVISRIYNNYLNDLSLSNLCLLKEQFVSLEIIAFLLGSGFESSDSSLGLFAPYTYIDQYNSIDFGLREDHIDEGITETWEQIDLCVELSEILILKAPEHFVSIYKTGYSILKKLMPLCYTYGGNDINFYISSDYELFITNSVFFTKQKAYITDIEFGKKQIEYELKKLQKTIPQILLEPFVTLEDITNRFQELINNTDTKEQHLQTFLEQHYRVLFGEKYNKCVSQLKIFHNKNEEEKDERRLDIALFDSVRNDWEIIELKKSNVTLIRKIRKIPTFSSTVTMGISQLQYYKELLKQDNIKEELKLKYNMDLEVPRYTLIIGNELNKDIKTCIDKVPDVTIKTYNQLLDEAKITPYIK